jgi:hypothetical protein
LDYGFVDTTGNRSISSPPQQHCTNDIAYYQVGFALKRLERLTEALAAFEKVIELGPESEMRDVFIRFRDEVAQELNR